MKTNESLPSRSNVPARELAPVKGNGHEDRDNSMREAWRIELARGVRESDQSSRL